VNILNYISEITKETEYIENYNYIIWLVLIFFLASSILSNLKKQKPLTIFEPYLLLASAIVYIGFRNYNIGIDTYVYQDIFNSFKIRPQLPDYDIVFYFPWLLLRNLVDFRVILVACAFLYVYPVYSTYKKLSADYYLMFILVFLSPYFFQFGINGMRNGVATSIFILGLGYVCRRGNIGWFVLILSAGIHSSMLFPLGIFFITKHIKSISFLLIGWLCILCLSISGLVSLSGIAGNFFSFGGRIAYVFNYLMDTTADRSVVIRNYLVYGIPPVAMGLWHIFKNRYDNFYLRIYKMYLLLNSPLSTLKCNT
jgi:hypothetical protein